MTFGTLGLARSLSIRRTFNCSSMARLSAKLIELNVLPSPGFPEVIRTIGQRLSLSSLLSSSSGPKKQRRRKSRRFTMLKSPREVEVDGRWCDETELGKSIEVER